MVCCPLTFMASPFEDHAAEQPTQDWDEEEEELLRNIGEHELLSGVQKQLYDQLSRKKYRCVNFIHTWVRPVR